MLPPVRVWTREEMMKRVARFKDLKGFSDGLQDSALPECHKTVFNVPATEHLLLFVIGGDGPQNEFTPSSMKRVEEFERLGK